MKFQTEKGAFFRIIWWLTILVLLGIAIWLIVDVVNMEGPWGLNHYILLILSLLSAISSFLMIYTWKSCYYLIDEHNLLIKFGPMNKSIAYDDIKTVRKSSSVYSGPAFSMNRLEITYKDFRYTVISPENQSTFLKVLQEKCPKANFYD